MSLHSVRAVTRALVHLSYKMASRPELNSGRCRDVRDVLTSFPDMKGIVTIRRSLRAGLCGPEYAIVESMTTGSNSVYGSRS